MAKRPLVLQNSFSFRLGLMYLLLFLLSSMVLFAFIFFTNTRDLEQQLADNLKQESALFNERYKQFGLNGVIRLLAFRAQNQADLGVFALSDKNDDILAGTIGQWPSLVDASGRTEFQLHFGAHQIEQPIIAEISHLDRDYKLLLGKSKRSIEHIQKRLIKTFLSASIVTLILGLAGAFWLSRRAIRRIEKINTLVNTTIQGDLTQRLTVRDPVDDLDDLSLNINLMLDRIQSLMTEVSGVANNIAHDLRTPLSHLRLQLEQMQDSIGQAGMTPAQELEEAINSADHILDTFNALLRISKIESTKRRESFALISLYEIVKDVIDLYEPLAEDKSQLLSAIELSDCVVWGDKNMLFQASSNLVDNAIKHTQAGTQIDVRLSKQDGKSSLSVCDSGLGVASNQINKLTKRFFQTDTSRSTKGNGLGLSLVAAIVKLHHAKLSLDNTDNGFCAEIRFPLDKLA